LKQICCSVISEGGYEIRGSSSEAKLPIASPRDLAVASTVYPLISLRLKSNKLDGIAILDSINLLGVSNNANYCWEIVQGGTTSGGTWSTTNSSSLVEYNQSSSTVDLQRDNLFTYQLQRNSFTSTPIELILVASTDTAGADVLASLGWQETNR
jgi:hypothetical protein